MTTSMVAKHWRGPFRLTAFLAAAAALVACNGGGVTTPASTASNSSSGSSSGGGSSSSGGSSSGGSSSSGSSSSGGGGTGVTPTAYTLFASNYVVYPSQQPDGSFLHSIQGGDVFTVFAGNLGYGCFAPTQANIDSTQFYYLDVEANSDGGPPNGQNCQTPTSTPPTTAADYAILSIHAPGTSGSTTGLTPLDISQSTKLLIQMGNVFTQSDQPTATGGNAKVFTVTLNDDTSAKQDGSAQTALCTFDQTLVTVGRFGSGTSTPLGLFNYAIPLSSFVCQPGSVALLQMTGVTSVSVSIIGSRNTNMVAKEFDVIGIGYIGFTK